jgi:hypothetical protein
MVFLSFSVFAMPAFAKKGETKKKSELAAVLGDVKWGDSKDTVLKKMKSQLMSEAKKDPKVKKDPLLMQQARKGALERHKSAEKSYTRLEGENTGYEVSVIADEFSSNNGESFIRVKDSVAQRFYFFIDGVFYKLVVAYNSSYLKKTYFESFVALSARKYGRPTTAEYDDIRGEEQLALVSWEDPETALSVKNKKELFDTYTMAFTDRQTLKRLQAKKGRLGGSDKDGEELSSQVQDLMASTDGDSNRAVVDDITGARTTIDFKEGRPKDDSDKRFDEDGNVIDADAADDGKAAKKDKKKPAKKDKKKPRKKKDAPDFSKIDSKSDDLIIY